MPVSLSPAGQAALVNPLFGTSPFAQANFSSPTGPFPADPNSALDNLLRTSTTNLVYPLDLSTSKYWMCFTAFEYLKASWNAQGQTQMIGTIFLPLAQQLVDSATVSYETVETGIEGGAVMSGFPNSASMAGIGKGAEEVAKYKAIQMAGGLAEAFAGAGGNIGAATQAHSGRSLNQYMTILLKGPSYKVREFSWVFSPRSMAESDAIIRVLAAFKNAQAPYIASEATNAFFGWPNIFQIKFQMGAGDSGTPSKMGVRLFDMLPAVMNDLVVDYTPAGAASFYGKTSAPTFIKVMMRFTELEVWLRNQYRGLGGLSEGSSATPWDASEGVPTVQPVYLNGGSSIPTGAVPIPGP